MQAVNTDVLIEKYGDWYVEDRTGERFIGNMRAFVYDVVPTVDVVEAPRWISVTEKLPEIDWTFPHSERYLVQYEDGDMDVVNRFWAGLFTKPHWNCAQSQTVVAWMPLPEPYEKETEDE